MTLVLERLVNEHSAWLVGLACLICLCGSALTLRLFAQSRELQEISPLQIALAGVIGGVTIWTTHFMALLAYGPGAGHSHEPRLTAASLLAAVAGAGLALAIASQRATLVEIGGAVLGLSVVATHDLGMSSLELHGRMVQHADYVAAAALIGPVLGAAALNRVSRPCSRHCWKVAVALMTAAILATHFVSMAGTEIAPDASLPPPPDDDHEGLYVLVFSAMSLVLFVGCSAFFIESRIIARARRDFERATLHDALTGLPNRVALSQRLQEEQSALEQDAAARLAVLTLDINRLKEVNGVHGHQAGDAVLRTIAGRWAESLQEGEFVARSGGDEFVAVKRGYQRRSEVRAFAERLLACVEEPIEHGAARLAPTAKIGVAEWPRDGADVAGLRYASDAALRSAKRCGAPRLCFSQAEMGELSRARLQLANDLRNALERDQLELRFQTQNDVETGEIVGFEALLRWRHPSRGCVAPDDFIPIAEETGLILSIGLWVLRAACREAAGWERPLRIAVNVAPQQLSQASFVEQVSDVLMETGLDPARLELEITEASILDDTRNTLEVIRRLKAVGARIAMDDFGTGYSSLASLRAFPFDKIKIDKSFVLDVHRNEQSAAIVRSTLLLGAALQIPVLAEGVETEAEQTFLRAARCREAQGFLFSHPMTAAEARAVALRSAGPAQARA